MYQNRFDQPYDCDEYEQDMTCENDCFENTCSNECDCCRPEPYPPFGVTGPTGPMGPRGARGQQGPRGLQGQQGKEGLQGLRGPQGVTGPQGVPGIQGPTGSTGPQGMQGLRGITGAMGMTGLPGPVGATGATGPAGRDGQSAPIKTYGAASMISYTDKTLCPQDALVFDIANIQSGFTIADDYQSLRAEQMGTYIIQFAVLVSNEPCPGDAIALEINHTLLVEESRMPVLFDHMFVTGCVIVHMDAGDTIRMVSDGSEVFEVCSCNNTVNAYLVIRQIN